MTNPVVTGAPGALPEGDFTRWWRQRRRGTGFEVTRIPFAELDGWGFDRVRGDLSHESGRFFSVRGLRVRTGDGAAWSQPVLDQPELGLLGLLMKSVDGVPHCLLQAKMEPGNVNAVQLSPTVQATRSNYTRVHRGGHTRYLEYFLGPGARQPLADVLHSEQGSWFWRKRNRNMIVWTARDVPAHEDFRWVPLPFLRELLSVDNLVNMDTRSVLACMPPSLTTAAAGAGPAGGFADTLRRSLDPRAPSAHTLTEVLDWIARARADCGWSAELVPLDAVENWYRSAHEIADLDARRFRVEAVRVRARTREVRTWAQPLLSPRDQGLAVFLTRPFDGVSHVLARVRPEPGLLDTVELAPTVRWPAGEDTLLSGAGEPFTAEALTADPARVRCDVVLSEEGGRFYHAQTRYRVVEVADGFPARLPPDYRWLTVGQLAELARHSGYLTVEARSLLACLLNLRPPRPR